MSSSAAPKVVIHLRAIGDAPILKQAKFKINDTEKFAKVIYFLRNKLHRETLFVYVNGAFSPNPDELVIDLYNEESKDKGPFTDMVADGEDNLPRDAKIVKTLLKSMGVDDYQPRVVHQFLELWYRYVVDVLSDSQFYAEYAGKPAIDSDDVKLAIQSKVNFSFSQPPPREVLMELARNRNKIPLPKSISGPGIALPPEEDTLISPNYQLAIPIKQARQVVEEIEDDQEMTDPSPKPIQEQETQVPLNTSQQVSFSIGAKRPRGSI